MDQRTRVCAAPICLSASTASSAGNLRWAPGGAMWGGENRGKKDQKMALVKCSVGTQKGAIWEERSGSKIKRAMTQQVANIIARPSKVGVRRIVGSMDRLVPRHSRVSVQTHSGGQTQMRVKGKFGGLPANWSAMRWVQLGSSGWTSDFSFEMWMWLPRW